MSANTPIMQRLNKALTALDLMHIKQALIDYLIVKDPTVENTPFNGKFMETILPYI